MDGGGSHRCALLGDNIAEMGYKNGWSVSHPSLPRAPHSCDTFCTCAHSCSRNQHMLKTYDDCFSILTHCTHRASS